MIVRRLGLVLERREDAERTGQPLERLYHWREPEEIAAIVSALEGLGYEVRILGTPRDVLDRMAEVRASVDFVVNLSVGFLTRTRIAAAPALLELAGLPHWGADPYAKMVSQNKHLSKALMDHLGLPTPAWAFLLPGDDAARAEALGYPLMVKPAYEGSSIGIDARSRVTDRAGLLERVSAVHRELGMPAVVERFVTGREVKVGMVGHDPIRFTGVIEDTLADGSPLGEQFLGFHAKKTGAFGKAPRDLGDPAFAALLADCRRLYRMFLPLDYATFDVRLDAQGRHWFLELNADATLHPARTLAQCAALHGIPFQGLIGAILETACARQGLRAAHASPPG